jgi:hypothetical protein
VGLFDILRGERAPKKANLDRLFALTTAQTTLAVSLGYESLPRAGVCFKPVEAAAFTALRQDLDQLLELSGKSTGTTVSNVDDEFGFHWIVLEDDAFDDLVATVHLVSQTIEEQGFSEQLLCSVFGFRPASGDGPVAHFVYGYKRGTFYPFVPKGDKVRDNATELRLKAGLEGELPIEADLTRWYPVWGAPIGG